MSARAFLRGLGAAIVLAAAGCALKSPPAVEDLRRDALPNTAVPAAFKSGGMPAPVPDQWLATFDDPALTALVAEAIMYNADLKVAAARVAQAGGYVKVAGAGLYPKVGVAALAGGKSGGDGSGLEGVWLNASLELDVWGRVRYGRAAALAQAQAAEADYAYARQSIAALVAKSWFVAIEAGLQRSIAIGILGSSQELLRVAEDRLRIGNGNEQSVAQARASVGPFRDTVRQVELAREQALRALELLLGRYPAAEIAVADRLTRVPAHIAVGVPAELLERRPDMVAAERRVAAAFNRVGEAQAARLPRISLTGGGSSVSSELFVLQERSNPVWSVGGNLLAPIFQGGALVAQVEIRTAEQAQAVAEYARAAQRAFGEVEAALSTERALRDRDLILEETVRDNERAFELVRVQYRVGSVDQSAVEQRQMALYSARTTRLRVQSELLAQRVNLYLALGGGFAEPVAPKAE
jgi:NodT family efflux transporter outer membrane factor (OMF) lipoprotein